MRDLGFDEVVGWSFTDPGEPGRLRIPADDPRANGVVLSNPLSEDQSVMRTTVLGSLLDVAQRNLARDADAVALFESGRVYLPAGSGRNRRSMSDMQNVGFDVLAGEFPGERPAPDREPHRIGCLAVGPARRQVVAGRWRGRRLLRAQGCARRRWRASSAPRSPSSPARSRSCIRAARPGRGRRRGGRLDRRAASLVCRCLGPRGRRRLRSRPGAPDRRPRPQARRPSRT